MSTAALCIRNVSPTAHFSQQLEKWAKEPFETEGFKTSSYYKVVVIRVPLQGQNATIDKVLWIGLNLLPQDGFGKAPTTALCF